MSKRASTKDAKKISLLLRMLRKRLKDYQDASNDDWHDKHERNRYEGIATGTRWAIEDIELNLLTTERKSNERRIETVSVLW